MTAYDYNLATGEKITANSRVFIGSTVTMPVGQTLYNNTVGYDYNAFNQNYVDSYYDNVVYKTGVQKKILTSDGMLMNTGTSTSPVYNRNYFLKDHLGNVRVVFDENGVVKQVSNYYPFGMEYGESAEDQAEMTYQDYQFGGKEFERDFELNMYDFGARNYDATVGRWSTMDPLCEKYYSISPYVYCGNNPVNAVDLNGDSITTTINTVINNPDGTTRVQTDKYYYGKDSNGNYGFLDGSGNLYSGTNAYVNSLTTALNDLQTGGSVGNALVSDLTNSTKNVQIAQGKNSADPNGTYIRWDPNSTTGGINQIGAENRPAYIGLDHEMAHIQDSWRGSIDNGPWVTVGGTVIRNAEKYATHIENQLRTENGIFLRTHYGIDASTGIRRGLESTRILSGGGMSSFYNQSNGLAPKGIPLLPTPFFYRRK